MILIDAHGSDNGLKIELDNRDVVLSQWGKLCEPNEHGSYCPRISSVTVSLRECLEYAFRDGRRNDSMHGRVITGALAYHSYWGGEEEWVSDDDCPCQHFGMEWPLLGDNYPEHMICSECGAKPEST